MDSARNLAGARDYGAGRWCHRKVREAGGALLWAGRGSYCYVVLMTGDRKVCRERLQRQAADLSRRSEGRMVRACPFVVGRVVGWRSARTVWELGQEHSMRAAALFHQFGGVGESLCVGKDCDWTLLRVREERVAWALGDRCSSVVMWSEWALGMRIPVGLEGILLQVSLL